MKKIFQPIIFLLFTTLLVACTIKTADVEGKALQMDYATLLQLQETDSFVVASVIDPWHSQKKLAQYVLVPRSQSVPKQMPEGILVRTPIERAALTTSVHAALLLELQCADAMAAITDSNYVVSPTLKHYLQQRKNTLCDAGQSMAPNVERLRAAKVDALLVSPFENAGFGALERMGIPLIQCADYMEPSPLGRAEWMKFYGLLFGCAERADSLFGEVAKAYLALKEQTQKKRKDKDKPTVMCDLRMGATWYQPGGASTMGQLIADAGGRYVWADRKESGSLPLDAESVLARAAHADIWIVKYGQATDLTYAQMAADFKLYTQFSAWKHRRIYACNTLHVPFFEETPFHPERVLRNLSEIFSGSMQQQSANYSYYTPLK